MNSAIVAGNDIDPRQSLAFIATLVGEYVNSMADRPATREVVKLHAEDAMRKIEAAVNDGLMARAQIAQAQHEPMLPPITPPPEASSLESMAERH